MQFLAEHESIAGLLDAMRVDDAGQGMVLAGCRRVPNP
jgi:hypothetical protein